MLHLNSCLYILTVSSVFFLVGPKMNRILERHLWREYANQGYSTEVDLLSDSCFFYRVEWEDAEPNYKPYIPFDRWVEIYPEIMTQFKRENNFSIV